ncbi:molybdenum ABC transporter ATP-binding protein [Chelativorans sp. Marseille-P2723]|uniref:molybdenum ABC transporter ATP-binding protein n=1 Tax=Chelativorans sp. Marseille-P2723 TaxID=2709133 RepID=UPI0015707FFF|nr:molybdenum ABC transporter ATP-binding protein [Chelativorans sp. Marseille-P2723]
MGILEVDISGRVGNFTIVAQFCARPGVTALFGRSGAGKSTILKMIAGTVRPERGRISSARRVLFDSDAAVDLPPRTRGIGFVFQEGRLFPHMTVRRNLTYARWAGGRRGERRFDEVVALLGLEKHLNRHPATLSGGERQRVAIGRALLAEPEILLMDEPLSSLDRERRADILPYLEVVASQARIPILYVSHETDEVAQLADRVVAVEGGKVRAIGTPAEILRHDRQDGGEPVSILEGRVTERDERYGTITAMAGGATIELPEDALAVGSHVRLRIRASDVAIAITPQAGLSIRNQLAGTIETVERFGTFAEVTVSVGSERIVSRVTSKSADALGLVAGKPVFALVKVVSVEHGRLLRAD